MIVTIRSSFKKDAKKLNADVQKQILRLIKDLESADDLSGLVNCKKITSHKQAFRIRLGNYRLGFYFHKNTIELVRILHRKDINRFFSD